MIEMNSSYNLIYEDITLDSLPQAYKLQKSIWPDDPDYEDLYDKCINRRDNNRFWLVYNQEHSLIGITGVDDIEADKDSIWLDWFSVLPEFRRNGYGEKILKDIIEYCKKTKYLYMRIDTTYYENRPALFLYDKVMSLKEDYTLEDTEKIKNNFLIYSISLKENELVPWNNRFLGLRDYYDKCVLEDICTE